MERVTRPRRYPRDPRLSSLVDQLQAMEDELRTAGDNPNAERMAGARCLVTAVALGVKRG
jgi:hypothetical protein